MGKPASKKPRKNVVIVELDTVLFVAPRASILLTARLIESYLDAGFEVVALTSRTPSMDGFVRQRQLDHGFRTTVNMMRGNQDDRDYLELKEDLALLYENQIALWVDNDLEFAREMLKRGVAVLTTHGEGLH